MNSLDYWKECLSNALEEIDVKLSDTQIQYIAGCISDGFDNYGQAFYSPPLSDFTADLKAEFEAKYKHLKDEFDAYRNYSESAIKRAFNLEKTTVVSVGKNGEIFKYDGRITQIQ